MLARSLLNHARFSRAKVAAAYSTAPNVIPPAGNAARWALIASGMSAVAAFAFFNKDSSDEEQQDETIMAPLQQQEEQKPSVYQEFLQTQEVTSQETLSSTSSLITGFLQSASGLLQENQMLRLGSGAQDSGWGSGIEVPFSSKHWKKKLERKQADYTRVNSASSERGYKLKTARKKATETLVELREEFGIPGISAAVSYKDDLLWETGIGWADVEQRVPCTPRSKMRIASISKPFTTAALAVLAEQQRIDLDAPIDRYLPGFSAPKILGADNLPVPNQQPITSRMLASHLSGIRHYSSREEFVSNQRYSSILQPLEQLQGQTLLADPGSKYIYSSYGYNVLGAVMAAATGVEFECLLKKLVTDPLKLSETVIDDPTRLVDQRSKQYVRLSPADALLTNRPTDLYGVSLTRCADTQIQPLQLVNAPLVDNTCKIPSGGLLSTPTDLVKFASYFINNTNFLKPETIQMLFTPHYTSTGIPTKYGLGWSIEGSNGDSAPSLVKHTGGACGGSSVLILFPEQRLAVSVVANLEDVNLSEAATRIAKHFIADIKGDTKKLVFETQTVRFDDDDLAKKPIKKHKKDKKQEKKKDKKKSKKSKKPKKEKQPKKDKKKDKKKDDKKKDNKKKDKKKDKKKKDDKSGEEVPSDETLPEVVLSEKQIKLLKELEKKQLKKEEKLKKKEAKKLKKAEKKGKKGKKGKKDKKKDKKKKKGKKGKKDKKKDKKKKKD